ncbi:Uncharacterized protein BM_BM1495 [Brugia malayi]|uniref:Bm1495 n=1 Tax=Brugia malayi TaxID=6279 RepID=A0A0J9Y2J6_BRUMA|nr:Uncharacterized protein BM_BM1495 [Brugia malayi]CDQ00425.1 Bm1495 [Brugia malayi]VIO86242.1 Uncharacterized protein BM_BM1495 [Brugia malayi]
MLGDLSKSQTYKTQDQHKKKKPTLRSKMATVPLALF